MLRCSEEFGRERKGLRIGLVLGLRLKLRLELQLGLGLGLGLGLELESELGKETSPRVKGDLENPAILSQRLHVQLGLRLRVSFGC